MSNAARCTDTSNRPPTDVIPHYAVELLGGKVHPESESTAVCNVYAVLVIFTLVRIQFLTQPPHH